MTYRISAALAACVLLLGGTPARGQSLARLAAPHTIGAFDLPDGFAQQLVAEGFTGATGMTVAPDGRVFVCEQTGTLRIVKDDVLLKEPFLTVEVDSNWERGLIGVTLDPHFKENGFVYVCYVAARPYPHHRVSRFTARGDRAVPGSEVILFRGDDQRKLGGKIPAGHQGGGIRFGADGKLYFLIGEHTNSAAARRLDTLQGKILRINPDGSIPGDNPFFDKTEGKYRAIWAYGLRNPFGLAVEPRTGRMLINDVGASRWEEINEAARGADYGWPAVEGPSLNPRYRPPLYAYAESATQSITGGVFYEPARPQFPARYQGKYFFADYILNWVHFLDPKRPERAEPFASGLAGPVALDVGPDGSLYVLNRNVWVKDAKFTPGTGSLHRIFHVAGSKRPAPVIVRQPADVTVAAGGEGRFRVEAGGEAPLRFRWQRDGKWVKGANGPVLSVAHVSAREEDARYRCIVSNRHGTVASKPAALRVVPLRRGIEVPAVGGLEYEYHEGDWSHLPTFSAETRVGKGTVAGIDLGVRKRDRHFALSCRGLFEAKKDGVYHFRVRSSGASRLAVAGVEIATTGLTSGPRAVEGAVGLRAGRHAFRLDFAHGEGLPSLKVRYRGPEGDERPVTGDRLFRIDRRVPAAPRIEPEGGEYTGPVLVHLSTTTAHAEVRYTLDGTTPKRTSAIYKGPFRVKKSATLTAATFPAEGSTHPTARARFTIRGDKPFGLTRWVPPATLNVPEDPAALPKRLSQTGIFLSLDDLTPAPGVIPYEVNAPLWSDGAIKSRWLALREGGTVGFRRNGAWRLPPGTVLVKHFELGDGRSAKRRRLETRLLVIGRDGSGHGVTYRWRPDQKDAELLPDTLTEQVSWKTAEGMRMQTWTYPGRQDCLICHTRAAGFVLGVNTRQLNRKAHYTGTGVTDNQIRAWGHAGILKGAVPKTELSALPRLSAVTDTSASLQRRARSYLDANCAQCHRRGGVRALFDTRFEVPLAKQGLIGGKLIAADLNIRGARVVVPGDRRRSMIYQRMKRRRDVFNMPPLATHVVDAEALDVVGRWIDSLGGRGTKGRGKAPADRGPRGHVHRPLPRYLPSDATGLVEIFSPRILSNTTW
jgi:uncharacterized repeat protein (TIGR03806 family)